MGFKGLLLSFLGVGAITSTVIGGYCIFGPDKSNTKQKKQNDEAEGAKDQASSQAREATPTTPKSAPEGPAKPNNLESRGAKAQSGGPARPEPSSAATLNTGSQDSNRANPGVGGPSPERTAR